VLASVERRIDNRRMGIIASVMQHRSTALERAEIGTPNRNVRLNELTDA
jgi:hypothetical protein